MGELERDEDVGDNWLWSRVKLDIEGGETMSVKGSGGLLSTTRLSSKFPFPSFQSTPTTSLQQYYFCL